MSDRYDRCLDLARRAAAHVRAGEFDLAQPLIAELEAELLAAVADREGAPHEE